MTSERQLTPLPSSRARAEKMGAYLITEAGLSKMKRALDQGHAFPDSAEIAGIPFELILQRLTWDDEIRTWYREAAGRVSYIRDASADILPEAKSPIQIKHDFLRRLASAGLFDKIAEMVATADPQSVEGREVIAYYARYLVKDVLPKETASQIEQVKERPLKDMDVKELLKELQRRRDERLELEQRKEEAAQVLESRGRLLKGPIEAGSG